MSKIVCVKMNPNVDTHIGICTFDAVLLGNPLPPKGLPHPSVDCG